MIDQKDNKQFYIKYNSFFFYFQTKTIELLYSTSLRYVNRVSYQSRLLFKLFFIETNQMVE